MFLCGSTVTLQHIANTIFKGFKNNFDPADICTLACFCVCGYGTFSLIRNNEVSMTRKCHNHRPLSPIPGAAVRSKVVVLLLLIHCFMYLLLFVGVPCWSLFWYALLSVLSSFAFIRLVCSL